MVEVTLTKKITYNVVNVKCNLGVRYWEDASVNGVDEDNDNPTIPRVFGDRWVISIDIETGQIKDWPIGTTAKTHYKVCDDGIYMFYDDSDSLVKKCDNSYVPKFLSPSNDHYADYVILNIDENGFIKDWKFNPKEVEQME
jgi:L-ascorbate metabolism protein UlaG (beta-lactamase superfamily)